VLHFIKKSFYLILAGFSLTFGGTVTVTWDVVVNDTSGAAETGTIYYQVYGQTFPAFPANEDNFLGATTGTSLSHSDSRIVDDSSHFFSE
jgi:hypothetical protein